MASETILVIDDSADIRDLLVSYILRPNGYATLQAANGAEGLALARQHRPALIVSDFAMPELNGLELAETLQRENLEIPFILITAEGSEAVARRALRAGVVDYFPKPFEAEEVLRSIRQALQRAQTRDALQRQVSELETLLNVGRTLTPMATLEGVLTTVIETAVTLTQAEESSLLLLDETTGELFMRAAKNFDEQFARAFRIKSSDSMAGEVIRTGQPYMLDAHSPHKIKTSYLVHALLYVPLRLNGRVIGVLGVDNRLAGRHFTEHDQRVLGVLSDYAAIAIGNAQLYARTEAERDKLETILKETEDGVMVADPNNQIIFMNPAARAAFKVNEADMEKRPLSALIGNTEMQDLFGGDGRRTEVPLEDGRVFHAHLTPIKGVGRAVIMQDITHLKQLDRIKSDFVTAVSHDLRSPLTAILAYVELIGRAGPVNEQQTEFIHRIQNSVQSITRLITDLLDLGRIEAGFDAQKEPTFPGLIVQFAVDGFRQQVADKHQVLELDFPDNLPRVFANPPRLRQLISNLIENALKYTPEGGTITIHAHAESEQVVIMVKDTGIGIPAPDQPYIFDKFYRASNSRTAYDGTGLGLSIVKSIAENHHGRIWVESTTGMGTTFTVVLPQFKEKMEGKG